MQPLDEKQLLEERLSGGVRKAMEVMQDAVKRLRRIVWSDAASCAQTDAAQRRRPKRHGRSLTTLSDSPDQSTCGHAILGEVHQSAQSAGDLRRFGLGDEERAMLAQKWSPKPKSMPEG